MESWICFQHRISDTVSLRYVLVCCLQQGLREFSGNVINTDGYFQQTNFKEYIKNSIPCWKKKNFGKDNPVK